MSQKVSSVKMLGRSLMAVMIAVSAITTVGAVMVPGQAEARDRGRHYDRHHYREYNRHWHRRHHYRGPYVSYQSGYYYAPPAYYGPPRVYYPPAYYSGPSLNVVVPIR